MQTENFNCDGAPVHPGHHPHVRAAGLSPQPRSLGQHQATEDRRRELNERTIPPGHSEREALVIPSKRSESNDLHAVSAMVLPAHAARDPSTPCCARRTR